MIRRLFPDAQIFAFEPIPEATNKACRLFRHDSMFLLPTAPNGVGLALGESSGRSILHLSRRADSSSLLPITDLQSQLFPRTEEIGTIEIEVVRLSEVVDSASLKSPSLLKIDVQGSELSVLKVTYYTLRKSPYFGAGIEGKEAIVAELTNAFESFGMIQNVRGWVLDTLINRVANVFWLHWIYFGLIGGIPAAYMIGRLMKNLAASTIY